MTKPGSPGRADPPRYTAGNLARESEIGHRALPMGHLETVSIALIRQ
jgi:hypothetical protein